MYFIQTNVFDFETMEKFYSVSIQYEKQPINQFYGEKPIQNLILKLSLYTTTRGS